MLLRAALNELMTMRRLRLETLARRRKPSLPALLVLCHGRKWRRKSNNPHNSPELEVLLV